MLTNNFIRFEGRIAKEPKYSNFTTADGQDSAYSRVNLVQTYQMYDANSKTYKDNNVLIPFTAFNDGKHKLADLLRDYGGVTDNDGKFHGRRILVFATSREKSFKDENGKTHWDTQYKIETIEFLDSMKYMKERYLDKTQTSEPAPENEMPFQEDDIPPVSDDEQDELTVEDLEF